MDQHQIKRQKIYYGFTLVELIIVITILAILATISFVTFTWYTKQSNDTKKLSNLEQINKGLRIYSTQVWLLPIPDEVYWTWIIWGVSVNYVWYIGDNISRLIRLNKAPKDNLTNNKYLYWVSWDFSKFQLATTMEQLQTNSIISKAHANYWSVKILWNYNYPLKLWNKLYSLPSLIFLWNEITSTWFLIDWWKNTINIKENNNQTISEILEKITWSWG